MLKTITLLLVLTISIISRAATVDTITIRSQAMQKNIKCVVIRPKTKKALPVVYLLHGFAGDFSNWIKKVPELKAYADEFNVMIVCPDGAYASWYFDSPVDSTMRYETYIGTEVPAYIDAHYATIKDRSARAITGLSMGGHGSLLIAFRHAATFGACGSMSGGVEMQNLKTRFDVSKQLGDTITMAANWVNLSVSHVVENPPAQRLSIIIDCGMDDIFFPENHALHEKLLKLKIPHDYTERPGQHDWNYWKNSVRFQLLFFSNYFYRK